MGKDPRRDYEYKIVKAVSNILKSDQYFIDNFSIPRTSEFNISDESLVLNNIPFYPAIAVYFENEVLFQNINRRENLSIYIDVACQAETKKEAQKLSFCYLKDIKETLWCKSNLSSEVDGEYIQVGFSEVKKIEPSQSYQDGSLWTYISTMELQIETA